MFPGLFTIERAGVWSQRFEPTKWIPRFRLLQSVSTVALFIFAGITLAFPPELVSANIVDIVIPFNPSFGDPFVVGSMTRSKRVVIEPRQELVGIRFKPGCAAPFLEVPMHELTDMYIPLESVQKSLHERFQEKTGCSVADEKIRSIEDVLACCLAAASRPDLKVGYAAQQITASRGICRIKDIAERTGWGSRHMERRFREAVGLSPKTFSRIVRFQNAHKLIQTIQTTESTSLL